MGYAFLSYSTKNQQEADSLRNLLRKEGIRTWMAPGDIPAGSRYAEVINQAIKDCSCFILVLSEDSQNSVWVAKEVERAVNYHKLIIPVQIEDVILNDEFELYLSTDQLVVIKKIDKGSPEVRKLLQSVALYTGTSPNAGNNSFSPEASARVKTGTNKPKSDPDYYSPNRPFYGAWCNCTRTQEMMINPHYVALFRKATDEEDIDAMLSIAIGFLQQSSKWSGDIIHIPKGNPDYRYYYWVCRAMYFTALHYEANKSIPMKYIATALWDAYTFVKYSISRQSEDLARFDYLKSQSDESRLHYESILLSRKLGHPAIWGVSCFRNDNKFDFVVRFYKEIEKTLDILDPLLETLTATPRVVAAVHGADVNTLQKFRDKADYIKAHGEEYGQRKVAERIMEVEQRLREREAEREERARQERMRQFETEKRKRIQDCNDSINQLLIERNRITSGLFWKLKYKEKVAEIDYEIKTLENNLEAYKQASFSDNEDIFADTSAEVIKDL